MGVEDCCIIGLLYKLYYLYMYKMFCSRNKKSLNTTVKLKKTSYQWSTFSCIISHIIAQTLHRCPFALLWEISKLWIKNVIGTNFPLFQYCVWNKMYGRWASAEKRSSKLRFMMNSYLAMCTSSVNNGQRLYKTAFSACHASARALPEYALISFLTKLRFCY